MGYVSNFEEFLALHEASEETSFYVRAFGPHIILWKHVGTSNKSADMDSETGGMRVLYVGSKADTSYKFYDAEGEISVEKMSTALHVTTAELIDRIEKEGVQTNTEAPEGTKVIHSSSPPPVKGTPGN